MDGWTDGRPDGRTSARSHYVIGKPLQGSIGRVRTQFALRLYIYFCAGLERVAQLSQRDRVGDCQMLSICSTNSRWKGNVEVIWDYGNGAIR